MSIVINFFIIAGKNVVLGTLVRADMVAFFLMEFALLIGISRQKIDR